MIFGGCDGSKVTMAIAASLLVVTLLIAYYVWTFAKDIGVVSGTNIGAETMCGGLDQLCCCNGNETMTSKRVTDNDLSQVLSGLQ